MEIRPCIIGPELSINPDIVINFVPEEGIPVPGIIGGTWETVLLIGENQEIALRLDLVKSLILKGMTGSKETEVTASIVEGQINIKGLYAGNYGNYFVYNVEQGVYWTKGTDGKQNLDVRYNTIGSFLKVVGEVNRKKYEVNIQTISEDKKLVKGNYGDQQIMIFITYKEEGIQVKGKSGGANIDYLISSLGDRIKVSGVNHEGYINYEMIMESETEIHIVGKTGKVPADYMITLYDNGASIQGNTGFFKSDLAFVIDTGEETQEETPQETVETEGGE